MKNYWLILIPLAAGAIFALGRLTVQPKIVTERVVEYHTISTSAISPAIVSEPIGSRIEKVMLRKNLFPNIDQVGDVKEDNFLNTNQIGDSTEMVKNHLRDSTKMVEGLPNELSNGCLIGLSNSQSVTDSNAFVTAELPIRDYTFTDDSTYTIVARGVYVESLPQIQLYPKTTSTSRVEAASAPKVTHGFQLGGGIAYTPKGLQPAVYFGYGLNIRF